MPPLRVLVTAFASVPGANHHATAVASMAQGLRAQLDVVSVLAEHQAHVEHFHGAQIFRVPLAGGPRERRAGFSRAVRRQLEASVYDVVHVRGPHEGLVAAELRDAIGYRLVYEVATFPDEAEGTAAEAEWSETHEACLEAADLVLVPTEAAARAVAEAGHGGKAAVVYPAVDVDAYDWWPSAASPALRLLYLGSYATDRDLPTVLTALRRVGRQHPVRVLFAGEPDPRQRARLRQMVASFGLSSWVDVRGEPRRDRVATLIASCDAALVPAAAVPRFQEHGDLPQPLLEHLACRRLVVASAVPAVSEVVRDEQEAYLYVPGDDEALAEMLFLATADRERSEQVAERAWRRVRERFSSAVRRRRIAEVYEMLVPGSQHFDAWREGFDDEGTGEHPMDGSLVPGAEPSGTSMPLPAEPSGASIPLPYEGTGDTYPAPLGPVQDDAGGGEGALRSDPMPATSPGASTDTQELPAESTVPGARDVALDTDPLGHQDEEASSTLTPPDMPPVADTSPGEPVDLPSESTQVEASSSGPGASVPPPPSLAALVAHRDETPEEVAQDTDAG